MTDFEQGSSNDATEGILPKRGRPKIPLRDKLSREEFYRLHWNENKKLKEIAELYGIALFSLMRLKKEYNLPTNKIKRKTTSGYKADRTASKTLDEAKLRELYCDKGLTLEEIGDMFGVSRQAIYQHLKKHSIEARGREEYKKHSCNERFFSTWSDKMAWVLGLVITDGSITDITYRRSLDYQCSDLEVVEKIRKALDSTHPIREIKPYRNTKKTQYQYQLHSRPMVEDLFALGIEPRKSLTVKMPSVPAEHFRHFLRGIFEGDGSIHVTSKTTSGEPVYRVTIVSGSKDFIEPLQKSVAQYYGIEGRLHKETKREFYQLVWSATEDVHKLGELMYLNVDESLLLSRKRDIFKEFEATQYQRFLKRAF